MGETMTGNANEYKVHYNYNPFYKVTTDELVDMMDKFHNGTEQERADVITFFLNTTNNYMYSELNKMCGSALRNIEDFISAGRVAVVEALDRYDPKKGMPLTYLSPHIKAAFRDVMNNEKGYSHYYSENMAKIRNAMRALNMDEDNLDEQAISTYTNLPISRVHNSVEMMSHKTVEYFETKETADEYADSPEQLFMKQSRDNEIHRCVAELDDLERATIALYFEIYDPVYNPNSEKLVTKQLEERLTSLFPEKGNINASALIRKSKKHLQAALQKCGIGGKQNAYRNARDDVDSGFKYGKAEDMAQEVFDALNGIEIPEEA